MMKTLLAIVGCVFIVFLLLNTYYIQVYTCRWNLDPADAQKIEEATWIDIRNKTHYNHSHIPKAIHISNWNQNETSGKTMLVYCYTGHTSQKKVAELRRQGYRAYSVTGGWNQLQQINTSKAEK